MFPKINLRDNRGDLRLWQQRSKSATTFTKFSEIQYPITFDELGRDHHWQTEQTYKGLQVVCENFWEPHDRTVLQRDKAERIWRACVFFFWLDGWQGKPCYNPAKVNTMGEEGHLDLDFQPGSYVGRLSGWLYFVRSERLNKHWRLDWWIRNFSACMLCLFELLLVVAFATHWTKYACLLWCSLNLQAASARWHTIENHAVTVLLF